MNTDDQLIAVGESAAKYIGDRRKWIHRRVEQITFPLPGDRVYRRDVSIDFTIPGISPVSGDGAPRYYVPLSLLERWPPLLRFDLRGSDGRPIPLLTADQNATVDAALLRTLARSVLAKAGLELDAELEETINRLAGLRQFPRQLPARESVLNGTLLSLIPPTVLGGRSPEQEALAEDHLFVELAGAMPRTTLLWLRVEGSPGDREVVKLSYDAPFRALRRVLILLGVLPLGAATALALASDWTLGLKFGLSIATLFAAGLTTVMFLAWWRGRSTAMQPFSQPSPPPPSSTGEPAGDR